MNQHEFVKSHYRPWRAALACSTAAVVLSLAGGSAAIAAGRGDHDRDRGGRYGRSHGNSTDRRGDRARDQRDDRGQRPSNRYDSSRVQRDGGSYYGDHHRDPRHEDHRDYRNERSYRGDDRSHRGGYDHRYNDRRFVVPGHIYRHDYRNYDRYFRETIFYAPHHHLHRVYLFPVIINGYVDYRPYAYCGDEFYPDQYGYRPGPYADRGVRGHFGLHFEF